MWLFFHRCQDKSLLYEEKTDRQKSRNFKITHIGKEIVSASSDVPQSATEPGSRSRLSLTDGGGRSFPISLESGKKREAISRKNKCTSRGTGGRQAQFQRPRRIKLSKTGVDQHKTSKKWGEFKPGRPKVGLSGATSFLISWNSLPETGVSVNQ